ncbi:hypothetical protein HPB49_017066 [Dermacentor silvarum]|uniref:Uncharacterized protein n=1 Tax=Dermacentor silvarum TaxID=543639 RepID=A0ACB8CGA6_DERSI|nr:hypothetical protein HPB49_017066 [Dermacentor silvarum]
MVYVLRVDITEVEDQRTLQILQSFWKLEGMGIEDTFESSATKFLDHFRKTSRTSNGRYAVALAWKEDRRHLIGGNRDIAVNRLQKLIYDEFYKPYRGRNAFQLAPLLNRLKSRGVIKLRSRDYRDPPILDPRYYSHPADIEIAAEAMLQCIRILRTKPFADLGTKLWGIPFPPCKSYTMWSRDYLKCMARHLSHTGWHQCCTNPMGSGPNAVVDPRLRVRGGVRGLRVVDASVMPDIVFDIIGSVKTRGFGGYLISRWATHFFYFIGTFVLTPRWPRASVW